MRMNITTKTLWLAVYRVFSLERVPIDCSLSLQKMMDDWLDSGLREGDLSAGLESLSAAGFIRLEVGEDGPSARLLDEQFGLLRPHTDDRQAAELLEDLRQKRRRPMAARLTGAPAGMPWLRRETDLLPVT